MSLFVKSVLLIIVCVCSVVLGGCTPSRLTLFDGDPYTADDIKSMVEEHFEAYHPRLVLQSSKVITTKPYKRNEYTFFDENNGFVFSARASVEVPQLPIPGGQRVTTANMRYAEAYLNHMNGNIAGLAATYGFHIATPEESEALFKSQIMRQEGTSTVPLFEADDMIFLNQTSTGANALALLRQMYDLYKPNGDGVLVSSVHGRKIGFYYLPNGETDKRKALYIEKFRIGGDKEEWRDTLMSGIGYSDENAEHIERKLVALIDRKIQQAIQGETI